jgi:hypothetical protein
MLSRADSATIALPLLEQEARITRAEFEELARPMLERTVRTTVGVIAAADLQPGRIAAVLLVGGSSRIPLVASLLRTGTSLEPAIIDQPETVVAEGSVRLASGATGETRASSSVPGPAGPAHAQPTPGKVYAPPAADPWATAERAATVQPEVQPNAPVSAPATALSPTLVVPAAAAPAAAGPAAATGQSEWAGPVSPLAWPPPTRGSSRPAYGPAGYSGYEPTTYDAHAYPSPPTQYAPGRRPAAYPAPVPYRPRKRRWPVVLFAVLALLGLAAGAVVFGPQFGLRLWPEVTATSSRPPVSPTTKTPVARPFPPAWLPADYELFLDDAEPAVSGPRRRDQPRHLHLHRRGRHRGGAPQSRGQRLPGHGAGQDDGGGDGWRGRGPVPGLQGLRRHVDPHWRQGLLRRDLRRRHGVVAPAVRHPTRTRPPGSASGGRHSTRRT